MIIDPSPIRTRFFFGHPLFWNRRQKALISNSLNLSFSDSVGNMFFRMTKGGLGISFVKARTLIFSATSGNCVCTTLHGVARLQCRPAVYIDHLGWQVEASAGIHLLLVDHRHHISVLLREDDLPQFNVILFQQVRGKQIAGGGSRIAKSKFLSVEVLQAVDATVGPGR